MNDLPRFMYGTAWKEDRTAALVTAALRCGFRAIDTANQRKHYFEAAVGDALKAAFSSGLVSRADLFLQTKFTFLDGQDHRLPYDPSAPIALQVKQSFDSSLSHLGVDVLDSYVLHGPWSGRGLHREDWEAWKAMQALCSSSRVRFLGISNVSLEQLEKLCASATVQPQFVQNRCYARRGWDADIRAFCRTRGIVYQGFSLLTANTEVLRKPAFVGIVRRVSRTPAQVIFRFARDAGMLPLTGTSDERHMREDLAIDDFTLTAEEIRALETISV